MTINVMDKPLLLVLSAAMVVGLLTAVTLQFFYWTQTFSTRKLVIRLSIILIPIAALSAVSFLFLLNALMLMGYAMWGVLIGSEIKRRKPFLRILTLGTIYFSLFTFGVRSSVFMPSYPQVWLLHFPNRIIMNILIWLKAVGLPHAFIGAVESTVGGFLFMMNNWAPIGLILGGMVSNLALYYLVRSVFKQFDIPPVPEFRNWGLSKNWHHLIMLFLVGYLAAGIEEPALGNFFLSLSLSLYFVFGLAVLWHFMHQWRVPRGLKFLAVMMILYNPITRWAIPILALLDYFIDFRGLYHWRGKQAEAEGIRGT